MDEIELVGGEGCVVRSQDASEDPLESRGTLEGFTYIGKDEALCICLGEEHDDLEGKTRVIPVGNIISIDLLDSRVKRSTAGDPNHYFG